MSKRKSKIHTALKGIKTVAAVLVAVLVLLELFIIGLSAFGGAEAVSSLPVYIMEVQSDSMAPKLLKGDSILCTTAPFEDVKVGDIITFYGNGDFITHEVVAVNSDQTITTKGLMNNYTDGKISKELYVGTMLFKLPLHSLFLRTTKTAVGKMVFVVAVLVLVFGYPFIKWCLFRIADKCEKKKMISKKEGGKQKP